MKLSKLLINNFRGIKHLEIEFERDVTVLIGENNSGKTTILEAIRFGLDTIKSNKICNFSEHDFHRSTLLFDVRKSEPIVFTLYFLESEDHPWDEGVVQSLDEVIVGENFSVIKLQLRGWFDSEEEELKQEWLFLDDAENPLTGKHSAIRDLRNIRPFFFQSALRAAKDEFHGQSTYWSSFLKNKDIDEKTRSVLENELQSVNQKIVSAHSSFNDVTDEVNRISELVSVAESKAVSVDPVKSDIYKTLCYSEVNILTSTNSKIPVRQHGEGTQSLSVLLLFSAYLKTRLKKDIHRLAEPIIAIEEPEAHLHPNAVRGLWHLIADLPGQKIIATHSGDILSEVPIEKIRRINKSGIATQCQYIPATLLSPEELRKFNHHVRRNRGELLFAKTWVLVEGETDVSVFIECAEILKINLHRDGIRLVEYSQAGGPVIFIKVANALGINWHVVADNDKSGDKYIESAKELLLDNNEDYHITQLDSPNTDLLLCYNGYGNPYRNGVTNRKEAELTEPEGTNQYWNQVYKIIKNLRGFSKPAAALEAILLMKKNGKDGVPEEIKAIFDNIVMQSGGTT